MSEADAQREPNQLAGVTLPEQQGTLFGHDAPHAALVALIETQRVPGGILLHGPMGIGKATLAFALAREILTATGDEDAARVSEQVAAGVHPNLFVLRRQLRDSGKGYNTVIRVDEVRELRERMRRTRGRAGHRVAIIDPIDDCNENAANALLKLLEEPPPETVFLLVSHRPGQLLPTIKSRCQSVALRPVSRNAVLQVLATGRPDAPEGALARAADLAGGRPRRGFEALDLPEGGAIGALTLWLADPLSGGAGAVLGLADALAAAKDTAEADFARDILRDWIAGEAQAAAIAASDRARLASANGLWEKANASFADAEEYNLDARQTLIEIFDAIVRHLQSTASVAETR